MSDSDDEMVIKPELLNSKSNGNNNNLSSNAKASSSNQKPKNNKNNEEDEEEEEEEDSDEEVSPKGRKRSRRDEDLIDDGDEQPALNGTTLSRDTDGYCLGSIVRIHCVNFQTYDNVSCYPGPDLNMIIGPNGTGKSTLAAAIAVGLGFPPKVLGKDSLSAFVKSGNKKGSVEIELKGPAGKKKNLVIKRDLNSSDDTTTFHINGVVSSLKAVTLEVKEYNVQINNLCSFLPQDKVTAFAAMSPAALLVETQIAAGDPQLSGWHKTLIEGRNLQKVREADVEKAKDQLKRREQKQAENEKTIKQFEQRRKIEEEIAVLSILVPIARYNIARETWVASKARKNEFENDVKELEAANKPFKDSEEALRDITEEYAKIRKMNQEASTSVSRDIKKKDSAIAESVKDMESDSNKLDNLRSEAKTHSDNVKRYESIIAKNKPTLDNKPAPPDLTEIKKRLRDINAEKGPIIEQLQNNGNEHSDLEHEAKGLRNDLDRANRRLSSFADVTKRREQQCAQRDPQIWTAVQWMRQNRANFKGRYYEPVRLLVSAKNPKAIKIAEAPIAKTNFNSFVFEKQEDYDYMMTNCADKGIGPNKQRLMINSWTAGRPTSLADYTCSRKFNNEDLKNWGFDCTAIDLVDAPEDILVYLCATSSLHLVPVRIRSDGEVDHKAVEASGRVQRYFDSRGSHTIKTSIYGNKQSQIEHRDLKNPVYMNDTVDQSGIEEAKRNLQALEIEKVTLQAKLEACKNRDDELHSRIENIDKEKDSLLRQQKKLDEPLNIWRNTVTRNDNAVASLKKELAKPSLEEKSAKLKASMAERVEKRVRLTLEQSKLHFKFAKLQLDNVAISLQQFQAETDLRAMQTSSNEKDQELTDARAAFNAAKAKTAEVHAYSKARFEEMSVILEATQDTTAGEEASKRREASDPDLDSVEADLATQQAALNGYAAISPQVLESYQQRKQEIIEWKERLATSSQDLEDAAESIAEAKALWYPKLKEMMARVNVKFSLAFDGMGMLGEVGIYEDEDYSKWGVEIRVSFRDSEALHLLTVHRQSGGERALATVMYLMSLAELSNAPFGLVDEINQGMDQRSERIVHNALVKTICKDDVGQYFLLTPKLLQGLDYHEKMKVLCIHNGVWLPEKPISLSDLVKNKMRKNRAAAR